MRIDIPTSAGLMPAYHRRPAQGAHERHPVVLVHEGFGLNRHIESIADRLAARGHPVVAPHLYYRSTRDSAAYTDVPMALDLARRLVVDEVVDDIERAACVVARPGRPVACLGFCTGGAVAYIAAARCRSVDRAVAYYPVSILNYWDAVGPPKAGLTILFGDRDEFLGPPERAWLSGLSDAPASTVTVEIHGDAGHAFFNDARPDLYARGPAQASWTTTLAVLDGR